MDIRAATEAKRLSEWAEMVRACKNSGTERDIIKLIPPQAVIARHVRYTYGCRECERHGEKAPVIKAAVDTPLINGSIASPEAVAQIMTAKFVMGTPLYRQEQDWNRRGIPLSRQTMSNWIIRCAEDYLAPIYERLHMKLIHHSILHADDYRNRYITETGPRIVV